MLTAVRSVLNVELLPELLGGVKRSDDFFLVMLSARTPPSWAVLRTELDGLSPMTPGICMRMPLLECLESMEGTGGVSIPGVSAGLDPFDLTLTTAALPRTMVWAGSGETIAFWRYMVEATLARARLGAMLVRPAVLWEAMESRKSGTKKCWSAVE